MNYNKIKEYCDQNRLSVSDLAEKSGVSVASIYRSISDESMKINTLEKIADALNVPIWFFFDLDPETPYVKEMEQIKNRIKNDEETLEQMTKVIEDLKRTRDNIKTVTYYYISAREVVAMNLIEIKYYEIMNNLLLDFLTSKCDIAAVEIFMNKMAPIMDTRKKVDKLTFMGSASYTLPGEPITYKISDKPIDITTAKKSTKRVKSNQKKSSRG